jgi:hypothetical protein
MNTAARIIFGIGSVVLLLGVGLLIKAGPSAGTEYIDPGETSLWRVNSTADISIPLSADETYQIWIKKGGQVNNISIIDATGKEQFWSETCRSLNLMEGGCDSAWLEVGTFDAYDCPCRLSLNATEEIVFTVNREAGELSLHEEYLIEFCGGVMTLALGLITIVGGGIVHISTKTKVLIEQPVHPQQ